MRGGVGLAPPAKAQKDKIETLFDPWSPKAEKKRLAKYFMDARSDEARALAPKTLPRHIKGYAEFMRRQSQRQMTPRDIAKAYLLTVGSMQRAAQDASKVCANWKTYPGTCAGKVRPEDVLGDLLRSDAGQTYLNALDAGRYDEAAAKTLAKRYSSFGFENTFRKQLRKAVDLGKDADKINKLLKKGTRPSWYKYVRKNIPGVSTAKAGFLASLMGRGDMATADARELRFWLCPEPNWDRKKRTCSWPIAKQFDKPDKVIDDAFMDIFNKRMKALNVKMPTKYRPFYEHLAHHALWDAIDRTKTTHAEVVEAMEKA
jgi:hypothetical protein